MRHILFLSFLLGTCSQVLLARSQDPLQNLRRSVFKIRTISVASNYRQPWKHYAANSSYGSGFYIGQKRIMTNAHVVANQRFLTVQKDGDPRPYVARVLYVAHDSDLALITVDAPGYFDNLPALKFGTLPKLFSPVRTVGYPRGGDQISITKGIVSRIGYRAYAHTAYHKHILVQVDSAINPGNSGGPVLQNGQVIGVAFQGFTSAQNTGYIIPTLVVKRFLQDIRDKTYDGTILDGLYTQDWKLINPDARAFYGLAPGSDGTYISFVNPASFLADHLHKGDILMAIDGRKVGVDGKIAWQGERVHFKVPIDLKLPGETLKLKIYRDRQPLELNIKVTPNTGFYQPGHRFATFPRFYTWGGLVFTSLSRNLLQTWGQKWYHDAPASLRYIHDYAPTRPLENFTNDFVVLINRLPHRVNTFVQTPSFSIVKSVNGKLVRSLADLKAKLEANSNETYTKIDYHFWAEPTILNTQAVLAAQGEIIQQYQLKPTEWIQE